MTDRGNDTLPKAALGVSTRPSFSAFGGAAAAATKPRANSAALRQKAFRARQKAGLIHLGYGHYVPVDVLEGALVNEGFIDPLSDADRAALIAALVKAIRVMYGIAPP